MSRMKIDGIRLLGGLCRLALVAGGIVAMAATAGEISSEILEINVTKTSLYSSGEPEIAVDPTNPDRMVYVATYYKYADVAGQDWPYNPLLGSDTVLFRKLNCFIAWSEDRGETWNPGQWPTGSRPYCGDPMVAAGPDGTFYIASDWMGDPSTPLVPPSSGDPIGVLSSVDGGKNWSRFGQPKNNEPVATGTTTDRPYLRVDQETGNLYVESGFSGRTMAVSSDHGLTWGTPVPFPEGATRLAAHGGIVATASQQSGQMMIFHASTDDGQTFTSHPVSGAEGGNASSGLFGNDWVSADPTTPGRFAVMQRKGGNYEAFVTEDTGESWSGPTVIPAPDATKPWMDFGSTGLLGVMWKTVDSAPFDVYSVVSFDHGRTFSAPVQVNHETSPREEPSRGDGGDDLSWIVLDDTYAYLGWGAVDPEINALNGYFGRVPLSLYQGN